MMARLVTPGSTLRGQAQQNQYMPVSVGSTRQSEHATAGYERPSQTQSTYGSSNQNVRGRYARRL
jgi:hypothetical protein